MFTPIDMNNKYSYDILIILNFILILSITTKKHTCQGFTKKAVNP
jgi:hypothetical protein